MSLNLSKLSLNRKLASIALLLGIIAIFVGDPTKSHSVSINTKDFALMINDKSIQINVEDLANWIIQNKLDYKLIDIRDESKFNEYNILGSQNIQIIDLNQGILSRNQKIILYSDDNFKTAQAWFLLKTKEYKNVYMLHGGLEEWKNQILFPKLTTNPTPEQSAKFEKMKEICKFFGGQPQMLVSDSSITITAKPQIAMPKLAAPTATGSGKQKEKVKKEGC